MQPDERILYGVEIPVYPSLGLMGRGMVKLMLAVCAGASPAHFFLITIFLLVVKSQLFNGGSYRSCGRLPQLQMLAMLSTCMRWQFSR